MHYRSVEFTVRAFECGEFRLKLRGVIPGYAVSLYLIKIYSKMILRNISGHKELKVDGHNITNLRYYAEDTLLKSDSNNELNLTFDSVAEGRGKR